MRVTNVTVGVLMPTTALTRAAQAEISIKTIVSSNGLKQGVTQAVLTLADCLPRNVSTDTGNVLQW